MCRFQAELGVEELCPEEACAFWDRGGVLLEGRCSFQSLDLSGRADLASLLLEIRKDLEAARTREEEHEARLLFFRRLNAGRSD
jgi:hypothetical protein